MTPSTLTDEYLKTCITRSLINRSVLIVFSNVLQQIKMETLEYHFVIRQSARLSGPFFSAQASSSNSTSSEKLTTHTFGLKMKTITLEYSRCKKKRINISGESISEDIQTSEKIYIPLMLVRCPKRVSSKEIHNIRKIDYMKIQIEPQRMRLNIIQCYRGQSFGHNHS